MRGKAGKAPKPVEDQIVGFNRQLGFALTFVESVLRQGNRRAAIEGLEEQRVAIARTSASVQRSLVGSSQHRRRVRAIGPFAIAAALVVASALGALAAVRRTPAPAQRASVTKVSPAVGAPAGPGSNDERITGPASRSTARDADSPEDAAALAQGTRMLIDQTMSMAVQLSGLSQAIDLTKTGLAAAGQAGTPAPAP